MKFPFSHRIDTSKPYTNSVSTDIRKTIAAERKRLAAEARQRQAVANQAATVFEQRSAQQ